MHAYRASAGVGGGYGNCELVDSSVELSVVGETSDSRGNTTRIWSHDVLETVLYGNASDTWGPGPPTLAQFADTLVILVGVQVSSNYEGTDMLDNGSCRVFVDCMSINMFWIPDVSLTPMPTTQNASNASTMLPATPTEFIPPPISSPSSARVVSATPSSVTPTLTRSLVTSSNVGLTIMHSPATTTMLLQTSATAITSASQRSTTMPETTTSVSSPMTTAAVQVTSVVYIYVLGAVVALCAIALVAVSLYCVCVRRRVVAAKDSNSSIQSESLRAVATSVSGSTHTTIAIYAQANFPNAFDSARSGTDYVEIELNRQDLDYGYLPTQDSR
jgi:hypothetical protein